ncbi:hypothetical protein B0H13DRAFT_2263093 [Mycena leptocephala]|nr:hypothetical protein B0H13DRAFT_2263093 [Mycena leptocephala]
MDLDVDNQPTEPQRVQELWFEDGNIVIQAGNSLYRVFRGILATHSSVFKDMLSFPQPPDSELVEGCSLVRLLDSDREVTPFLKALFDPQFFEPFPASTSFEIIAGCLRLSHKYGVDYLHRRALIHLSSGYRTKLVEWDKFDYHQGDLSRPATEICSWDSPTERTYMIAAIQLAREIDTPWILPSAFYELTVGYRKLGKAVFHEAVCNGVPASLSAQDQDSFAQGHYIQTASTMADILQFLFHPSDIEGCKSSKKCFSVRLQAMESLREDLRGYASAPLDVWEAADWRLLENLCPACLAVLKQTHKDARQVFWDKLPEIYGLPEWEELERLRAAAIGTNIFS